MKLAGVITVIDEAVDFDDSLPRCQFTARSLKDEVFEFVQNAQDSRREGFYFPWLRNE